MSNDDRAHLALAIALISLAGYVDAVGFLRLGDLFISFMSGNSTRFAVALSHGMTQKSAEAGAIIALYVLGVIAGRLLATATKAWRRPAVLIVDAALLALAALVRSSPLAIAAVALAMGLQNEALHRAGRVRTNLTYVTGTLVHAAEAFADALTAKTSRERWAFAPYLALYAGLMFGAGWGAVAYRGLGLRALLIPVALLLILAGVAALLVVTGHDNDQPE